MCEDLTRGLERKRRVKGSERRAGERRRNGAHISASTVLRANGTTPLNAFLAGCGSGPEQTTGRRTTLSAPHASVEHGVVGSCGGTVIAEADFMGREIPVGSQLRRLLPAAKVCMGFEQTDQVYTTVRLTPPVRWRTDHC